MIFTTPEFVLFFLLFFWIYAALPKGADHGRGRKLWLLGGSYFFYGSWDPWCLLLILASTVLDFSVGRRLGETTDAVQRKRLVTVSLVGNLGILAFFKYFNFFADSLHQLLGAVGLDVSLPVLEVVLPVGISFYTFQTLSYTIDIYRGRLTPTERPLDFALFVAFFPQLVAGPIERASHLLPQIERLHTLKVDPSGWGFIAIGVFKKAIIADHIGAIVELTYADPANTHPMALWLGTYAFAIQIYCDFSGYSDIAVGLSRLLGLDLVQNFAAPYAAAGPSEFWRRWHISLSSWLRDYLYIPLGGNRGPQWFVYRNLMLTMLLGGLWHGAAWNFVLWGAWHGLLLAVFRPAFWDRLRAALSPNPVMAFVVTLLRRLVFFHLVCLGWALFRAQSLAECVTIWGKLLDPTQWAWSQWMGFVAQSGEGRWLAFSAGAMLLLVLAQNVRREGTDVWVARLWRGPAAVRFVFIITLLYTTALLAPEAPPPFIYFQF
ncbi:MAG: MBOAT family O-acyltransferase [Bradymonadia bacterium]